jgi:hypothetical protein
LSSKFEFGKGRAFIWIARTEARADTYGAPVSRGRLPATDSPLK